MSESFDWTNPESVAVQSVQGIAVYLDEDGMMVIRQEHTPLDDEDTYIVLPIHHAKAVVRAIHKVIKQSH